MSGQMRYLQRVAWILKQCHVLHVQTDGAGLFYRERALHEAEDGCVIVMTLFGEKLRDPTVRFSHQVIYDA